MKNKRIVVLFMALILCLTPIISAMAEMLRMGDSGELVLKLQQRLFELGYEDTELDGTFGEGTKKAVREFQRWNDLMATGMADDTTQRILFSEEAQAYEEVIDAYYAEDTEACYMAYDTGAMPMLAAKGLMTPEGWDTREYTYFRENGFNSAASNPLSTFAADVDTASWAQVRQMLLAGNEVPKDSVRVEEILNYFNYDYKRPEKGEPFGVTMELGDCPWQEGNKLLLVGLQAEEIERDDTPMNLVFLIDVSGSMDEPEKLPLVKRAFTLLLEELRPTDTVSIVTYASNSDIVLDGVPAANGPEIMEAINNLMAGGSTNGGEGILSAYAVAEKHMVEGGVNRILLATDGDLNVGISDEGELARLVTEKKESGVSLTVLGFGGDNYKDNRMEALADYGDGNYRYIDTIYEARKALINEAGGTFNTVAKDVKLQLDFNPAMVKGYRLIGYEDRLLNDEDFANDSVDGGEIGSGHRVTALYEIVPAGSDFDIGSVESKYVTATAGDSTEWLTLSVRAKAPDSDVSTLYTYTLADEKDYEPTQNSRFAAGIAEFAMLIRDSEWKGTANWNSALELLRSCESVTGDPYKEELVYIVGLAERANG